MAHSDNQSADPQSNRLGVAALQLALSWRNNIECIAAEVSAVKRRMPWIAVVVVGELAAYGSATADARDGEDATEAQFCKVAREAGVWLLPGSFYEKRADCIVNMSPVISPAGEVVTRYCKQFPFRPYECGVTPGDTPRVFDIPGIGRLGVSICYDMWFPETTRSLASMGAELILHPTLTDTIDRDVELAIARASAATNQCYFVDVNVAGDLGVGRSCIYGPGGEVVHEAGSGREIIAFEADLGHVRHVRENGWHGLGQPLKSFRDSAVEFTAYGAGAAASESLSHLGALRVPGQRQDGSVT